jgi:hypothetical protein
MEASGDCVCSRSLSRPASRRSATIAGAVHRPSNCVRLAREIRGREIGERRTGTAEAPAPQKTEGADRADEQEAEDRALPEIERCLAWLELGVNGHCAGRRSGGFRADGSDRGPAAQSPSPRASVARSALQSRGRAVGMNLFRAMPRSEKQNQQMPLNPSQSIAHL